MDRRVRWTSLITFFLKCQNLGLSALALISKGAGFDASIAKKYLRLLPPQHTILVFWSKKFFCIFYLSRVGRLNLRF